MKKIPTIFARDLSNPKWVTSQPTPGCEWVFAGEGLPTRQRDGRPVLVRWVTASDIPMVAFRKHHEAKAGRKSPAGFEPIGDPNPKTGHQSGWVPLDDSSDDQLLKKAIHSWPAVRLAEAPGTYEFCGPKVNGNPEGLETHQFFKHGSEPVPNTGFIDKPPGDPTYAYAELFKFFGRDEGKIKGIVWHHPDGRMAKIKRRDFGFPWPAKKPAGGTVAVPPRTRPNRDEVIQQLQKQVAALEARLTNTEELLVRVCQSFDDPFFSNRGASHNDRCRRHNPPYDCTCGWDDLVSKVKEG